MRIALVGPFATEPFREGLGLALTGAPPGVIQTPIGVLGVELVKQGHQVCAITNDPAVSEPCRFSDGDLSLVFLPLRNPASRRALDLFEVETRLLHREIDRFDPDIVHAHWTYEYAEAAVRTGRPHLVTMHDVPLEVAWSFKNAYRALRAGMAFRVMPRIRALTVVSPRMAGWARAHGYFGPITAIPNGVPAPAALRTRGGPRRGDGPVIAMVGDVSVRKNIRVGLEAFRRLRVEFPAATLHLFGGGLDQVYAGDAPGVLGHGPIAHSELMTFLANGADLLVHPSLQETFGVILAEAMVRGVPVVAGAKSGGVRQVVGDTLAHLLVDVRSAAAIATKAAELLNDPGLYRRVAEDGRERIETQFSAQGVTSRYMELYQSVIASQSGVAAPGTLAKSDERQG